MSKGYFGIMPERDYVSDYCPPEEWDKGANDEGFYYFFCECSGKKTEHEDGCCCLCGEFNDPAF